MIATREENTLKVVGDIVKKATGSVNIRRNSFVNPHAISATLLKALTATSASVATDIVPTAQPDFARTVSVTPGGTTADVASGTYTLTGTDIRNQAITEDLTFAANATTKQVSTKAFKTVTKLHCPIQDGAGATFSIGVENKLGVDRLMTDDGVIKATVDAAADSALPAVTVDSAIISKNTVLFATATDGAHDYVVTFLHTDGYYPAS